MAHLIVHRAKNDAELRALVARGFTDLRQTLEHSAGNRLADIDSDDAGDTRTVRDPFRTGRAGAKRKKGASERRTKKAKKASKKSPK